jgi:cytochrome c2
MESKRSGPPHARLAIALFALLTACGAVLVTEHSGDWPSSPVDDAVQTSQHIVAITRFSDSRLSERGEHVLGGAITPDPGQPGRYFLVQPSGHLLHVSWASNDQLQLEDLGLRVPINSAEFALDAEPWISKDTFRVADLLALRGNGLTTLYASHHYWKVDSDCFVVRISSVGFPDSGRVERSAWSTIFESSPCLPIKPSRGTPFAGAQIGGNLELLDERRLLLTLGDHQFDGWYRQPNLIDDPNADYGKTIAIDMMTGAASVFTSGHRNPEGLTVDARGRIWSTEHGPQGGDELNLLEEGKNYGYPRHTYGTEYGATVWPPAADAVRQSAPSELPVFAWVPSIGISDLVAVTDPAFSNWQGDLLVSSLAGRSLWRARFDGDRVVYVEPIKIGERVRDLASGPGELVLWTDAAALVRIRPIDHLDEGSELFAARCGGCHDDEENRIGPTLVGMFDRPIGSAAGYDYTTSLTGAGGYWTESRLDAFLSDPQAFAPGANMTPSVRESHLRDLIIAYLRHYY